MLFYQQRLLNKRVCIHRWIHKWMMPLKFSWKVKDLLACKKHLDTHHKTSQITSKNRRVSWSPSIVVSREPMGPGMRAENHKSPEVQVLLFQENPWVLEWEQRTLTQGNVFYLLLFQTLKPLNRQCHASSGCSRNNSKWISFHADPVKILIRS